MVELLEITRSFTKNIEGYICIDIWHDNSMIDGPYNLQLAHDNVDSELFGWWFFKQDLLTLLSVFSTMVFPLDLDSSIW